MGRSGKFFVTSRIGSFFLEFYLFCSLLVTLCVRFCSAVCWFLIARRLMPRSAALIRSSAPSIRGPRRARPSSLRLSCEVMVCDYLVYLLSRQLVAYFLTLEDDMPTARVNLYV